MAKYTAKQQKELAANPHTLKVTASRIYFTADFKEKYWISYQNGESGKDILKKYGYNPDYFEDSTVHRLTARIKKQAAAGGFTEGPGRRGHGQTRKPPGCPAMTHEDLEELWVQVQYLTEEVEFLKKLCRADEAN